MIDRLLVLVFSTNLNRSKMVDQLMLVLRLLRLNDNRSNLIKVLVDNRFSIREGLSHISSLLISIDLLSDVKRPLS